MAGKDRWLDSGLELLGQAGPSGVTIERLVDATGLSTGSFYHHFAGMPGYRSALLAHFEQVHTERYIADVEASPDQGGREKLRKLMELVLDEKDDWNVEVAIRAWALEDANARAAKERVDATRLAYLRALWMEISGGDEQASDEMASMLYLLLLGAGSILPPVSPARLRALYDRLI